VEDGTGKQAVRAGVAQIVAQRGKDLTVVHPLRLIRAVQAVAAQGEILRQALAALAYPLQ
tara:strand:- start:152 stop:331 length:180 start_codon:yes stop_codon:yes gene_type:complete